MASSVTRDHHNLRRNLKLNSNYISNDGGDEGITIDNDGIVTASSQIDIGNMSLTTSEIDISSGGFTLDVSGQITLEPDPTLAGGVKIDKDSTLAIPGTPRGLWIDYDHEGSGVVDGATVTGTGLDLDMNCDSPTHVGTVNQIGIDLDMVAGTSGTQTNTGIDINVSGADTNYALITTGGNVGIGVADPDETLEVSGDVKLSGNLYLYDTGGEYIASDGTDLTITSGTDILLSPGGNVGIGVTDPDSLLEVFGESAQLKLSWDASNHAAITVADDGHLELATTGTDGDITLDSASGIMLETSNLYVYPTSATTQSFHFYMSGAPKLTINSQANAGDEFSIQVNAEGATTITTVDADTAVAHLDFAVDGHIDFNASACGFTQKTATFGDSPVIGDGGNSTDIDFRKSNKVWLELTGNIGAFNDLNLIFPAVSGNFVLVLEQDGTGSQTIHADAWEGNMFTSDGSTLAATANPLWAGGTAPTLTTTADYFDIISFYWDAVNGRVFAVPTLNFS